MGKVVTVLIAEDQRILKEGLRSLLAEGDEYRAAAEVEDGLKAIRGVAEHKPDLVLIDLSMPKMGGISAMKEIRMRYPETKVLALTIHKSDEYILAAYEAGADGYCLKDASHMELLESIRNVLLGKPYFSPDIAETVLEGYLEGKKALKPRSSWETLTQREKEVLKLIGEGNRSKQIADHLCISWKTVEKHRANIMRNLDLHTVSALTAYAIRKGLVVK